MIMKRITSCLSVAVFLLFICGCGGTRLSGLVPGVGTITLNGEPVEDALILFAPINSEQNQRSASAKSTARGKFSAMTLKHGDGIYPGEYRVTVKKTQTLGDDTVDITVLENRAIRGVVDDRATVYLLPIMYNDPTMTDLMVTIPAKGSKSLELKLVGEVDLTPIPYNRDVRR